MGVATSLAVIGTGVSAYSAIDESKKKKNAQKALENLPTPDTSNVAENLQVSTRGADLRTQEAGRTSASAIDALRGSGARGIIGGVGAVQAQNAITAESIGANLDEQQKNIDIMKANDEVRIQGVKEGRYQSDVAGLSSQINSAEDAKKQSIENTLSFAKSAGTAYKNRNIKSGTISNDGKSIYNGSEWIPNN